MKRRSAAVGAVRESPHQSLERLALWSLRASERANDRPRRHHSVPTRIYTRIYLTYVLDIAFIVAFTWNKKANVCYSNLSLASLCNGRIKRCVVWPWIYLLAKFVRNEMIENAGNGGDSFTNYL